MGVAAQADFKNIDKLDKDGEYVCAQNSTYIDKNWVPRTSRQIQSQDIYILSKFDSLEIVVGEEHYQYKNSDVTNDGSKYDTYRDSKSGITIVTFYDSPFDIKILFDSDTNPMGLYCWNRNKK